MDNHLQHTNTDVHGDIANLSVWQLFCYGLLSLPIAMGGFALVTYIPTFYAFELGLGLSLVGLVFVFGRLLDVVTDPLIGHLSDKTRSILGPRRPWMIIGVPFFCLAVWILFTPPDTPSLLYLILASGAYFLFYTALDVPYSSVGLEISPYIHERSVLASTKAIFQVIGALTAAFIPFIFVLKTDMSLSRISQLITLLSVVGLVLFLKFVPRRTSDIEVEKPPFLRAVKTSWRNRTYRMMIIAFFIIQTANALIAALTVLFVTNIINAPSLTGLFLGVLFLSSAVFLPFWIWVSKRWSKKTAWVSACSVAIIVLSTTPLLGEGDVIQTLIFSVLIGAAFGCDAIMPTSMLADIVYKTEQDGIGRFGALYLAIKNSVSKLTFIAPMGLAFPALDLVGFVSGEENSSKAVLTLWIFYAAIPIAFRLVALAVIAKMPKTESLFD